jgi:hypothetical protein
MNKPQYAEMTPEECATEQASEFERLKRGDMSETELKERIVAWKRAAERQQQQADVLERAGRVARASGCPGGQPPVRWLISKGLAVDTGSGYAFTERTTKLFLV